jgi:hypothetical protein
MAKKEKPGVYDAVLDALPPRPPDDWDRQLEIDKIKEGILKEATHPVDIAKTYGMLRREKKVYQDALYALELRIDAHEQLLVDSQEGGAPGWGEYGATSKTLRLQNGGSVRVQGEPYGSVNDKESFRLWCIANGYERQLQLHAGTMNSIVKERVKEGAELPDGVEAFSYKKIYFTDGKE